LASFGIDRRRVGRYDLKACGAEVWVGPSLEGESAGGVGTSGSRD